MSIDSATLSLLQWHHNERDGVSNHRPVCSTGAYQRKHQSSASLAFGRGIQRWPVNSPHKGPVTWKMFSFDVVIMSGHGRYQACPASHLLRTPISAKYCWFGWWLGAWSTPSHDPTQLCDIYISGYKYTLISEWTRLFGLLRSLDNLVAGAVCYFCTTISVFCEIYTLRMRVVAHAAILWVWCVFIPSSGVGLVVSVPINTS